MKPKRAIVVAGLCLLITIPPCVRLTHRYHQVYVDRALITAIETGDANAVDSLLAAGANPNTWAIPHKQKPLLQLLRDLLHPPLPATQGRAALFVALRDGQVRPATPRVVKSLIAYGANVNARLEDGTTPLQCAAQFGLDDCLRVLIDSGANVRVSGSALGCLIVLHRTDGVRMLIAAGADVSAKNDKGESDLWVAAQCGWADCLKAVVAAGADINATDRDGNTPLMEASYMGHLDCVNMLLMAGASVRNRNVQGMTALGLAKSSGGSAIIERLQRREP